MADSSRKSKSIENHIKALLNTIKNYLPEEVLLNTPKRVAETWAFLTSGYKENPRGVLAESLIPVDKSTYQMVLVKDIDFFSLCEHHLLPFFGKAHVAFIPRKYIVGISKVVRLVEILTRRLQLQERLTSEIVEHISEILDPFGVAVYIEAEHLCMKMRGVRSVDSKIVTTSFTGYFNDEVLGYKEAFLKAIGK